jgi:peptidoglycan/xylan/chitin deacetylase (PgdA/CDA1 family)
LKGVFTISLDFELHWGGFEKWPVDSYRQYFLNTRTVIPEILKLFTKYDVNSTWATVGMLFNSSRSELFENAPQLKPSYQQNFLSAYHYIETAGIGSNEQDDPLHFAQSLIQNILSTPNQEIGSHTYSHYYCNEPGQTLEQFRADLRAAQHVALKFNKKLKSLVFPRNQFNDEYLKVCFEEGIQTVRTNPLDWFWKIDSTQKESMWKRLNRGVDAYWSVGKKNTYALSSLHHRDGYPLQIPASRLLRPYRPSELFLNNFKITKIKSEMTRAAEQGEVYHLWWHPHNFGNFPEESLRGLEQILEHYEFCQTRWRMRSLNMEEIFLQINAGHLVSTM